MPVHEFLVSMEAPVIFVLKCAGVLLAVLVAIYCLDRRSHHQ